MDEILTYGLANDETGRGVGCVVKDGVRFEPSSAGFIDYLTVSPGNRFDYESVWRNQKNDVHPPLYYAVIHTVCSLTPGRFSIWSAGIVNIICALFVLHYTIKIAEEFTQNRFYLNLLKTTFILCAGMLSAVSFFRMYVMAMLWVTWITCVLIRVFRYKQTKKFYFCLFALALCGGLTHYYCIVYLFFISVVYGMILLYEKQWKQAVAFILTMATAGGCALAVFPAMVAHILFSGHGTGSVERLGHTSLSETWSRLKTYFGFLDTQIFGRLFLVIICFGIILKIVVLTSGKQDTVENIGKCISDRHMIYRWLLLVLPGFLYFLVIAKTATYVTDRYIFPIYAVAFVSFTLSIISIAEKIFSGCPAALLVCALFSVMIVHNFQDTTWDYLFRSAESILNEAETHAAVDCIYIYKTEWKALPDFYEISRYKSVTFIKDSSPESLSGLMIAEPLELIVLMEKDMDEEHIKNIIDNYPYLNQYEKTGEFGYTATWRLYREQQQ